MSAITAQKKYGISPSVVHFIAMNCFSIHGHEKKLFSYRDCFSKYYLLYWSSKYFLEQMKEGTIIDSDGNLYHIIFKRGLTRGKLLGTDKQLALSFRVVQPEFNIPNYVLVDSREG